MKKTILAIGCTALIFSVGCKNNESKTEMDNSDQAMAQTDSTIVENDWKVLFDGENLDSWKSYNKDSISDQWQIEGDAMVLTPAEGRQHSENLITKDEFENFELSIDWKISEGGNSGVMWAVQEDEQYGEPYLTGPEVQILDNEGHPDGKNGPDRFAGALYDMKEPSENTVNPVGEWNSEIIHIDYQNNEGWIELNGTKIVDFDVKGDGWNELVQNSKFASWDAFGKKQKGHIALQDHGHQVSFRNIKIKELE